MPKVTPKDHVLTTLAIKRHGKFVDVPHIQEKLSRDAGEKFSEEGTLKLLAGLERKGLVESKAGEYAITDAGRKYFDKRWREVREQLNQDYLKVYRAKQYYPHVTDALLEFCRDRHVSVFRLFTGRAWLQRKLGKRYIMVKSLKDVQYWLNVHGIDFIPYLHKLDSKRPDWFVIDFDAGEKVDIGQTKSVVEAAIDILKDFGIKPAIKFSGSRGFQVWAKLKPHDLPRGYKPLELRGGKRERNYFNFYADLVRFVEHRVAEQLKGLTTSDVAHKKARIDKVLLDSSIYKPLGDVRAPYSIHHKTGLVSMPLGRKELKRFRPEQADPDHVVKRYKKRGNEFVLSPIFGGELFNAATKWIGDKG